MSDPELPNAHGKPHSGRHFWTLVIGLPLGVLLLAWCAYCLFGRSVEWYSTADGRCIAPRTAIDGIPVG